MQSITRILIWHNWTFYFSWTWYIHGSCSTRTSRRGRNATTPFSQSKPIDYATRRKWQTKTLTRYRTTFTDKYYTASSNHLHEHLNEKFLETKLNDLLHIIDFNVYTRNVYFVTWLWIYGHRCSLIRDGSIRIPFSWESSTWDSTAKTT